MLRVPEGWTVIPAFEDICLGEISGEDGWNWYPTVEALSNDKMHMLRSQGQFFRRLVVCKEGDEQRARAMVTSNGRISAIARTRR